jgi:phosphomannomutase
MKSHLASSLSVTVFGTILFLSLFPDVSAFTYSAGITLRENIVGRQGRCHRLYATQPSGHFPIKGSVTSVSPDNKGRVSIASDAFLKEYFQSDVDDVNLPPSMSIIHRSMSQLASGSDIRGKFVNHPATGRMAGLARSIGQTALPALTPFAAHCLGFAFATMIKEYHLLQGNKEEEVVICIGRDPREHGVILADSFARGAGALNGVKVFYTGIATTPALFEFCRSSLCHGGTMVTASHLPDDRNGFKFFDAYTGGFQKSQINKMIEIAQGRAQVWFNMGILPPTSVGNVYCSAYVNWMNHYQKQLEQGLLRQVSHDTSLVSGVNDYLPLKGLKIVLNAGNGSGGFFLDVLTNMGADVEGSINIEPDPAFPRGVPNPENDEMVQETILACEAANADLGILLDTDADRCGMVAPRSYTELFREQGTEGDCFKPSDYEPLNRNRLIALMGVIYARQSPGCAIVTDSVTSNGLSKFLEEDLNLVHIRYLRGYANVIQKAKSVNSELSANAEVAIETSGHCAVKENGFLDDGTFTALKVLGLLAQERQQSAGASRKSILDLLSSLEELDEVTELRLHGKDGSLESVIRLFDLLALQIETHCEEQLEWSVDRDNLEGIRVLTGKDGGFFLLRKSLHDPVICLQVEASSKAAAKQLITSPLLRLFQAEPHTAEVLDLSALEQY